MVAGHRPESRRAALRALALALGLMAIAAACGPSSDVPAREPDPQTSLGADAADPGDAVRVHDARIAESVNGESMSVYAVLAGGPTDDALVGIRPALDAVGSLHAMEHEGGMMAMRAIERIEVPAGATVELRPGVVHGMLERIGTIPAVGDTLTLTFVFASGAEVTVRAPVLSMAEIASGGAGHQH